MRERRRVSQDERPLPQVAERQRRKNQREPGDADRARAEVSHVGVESLAAGDGEDDDSEDRGPANPVMRKVDASPRRASRAEDAREP